MVPVTAGRVVLVPAGAHVPAGCLPPATWRLLAGAGLVLADAPAAGWAEALADAGVPWQDAAGTDPADRADRLRKVAAAGGTACWFGDPVPPGLDPDETLPEPPAPPGARFADVVALVDRLRSPGGCPWDARQNHTSLLPYLLEETHEVIEAVESGDRDLLLEELGDLLYQVVFHARVASEGERPFDVDEVCTGVVRKLVGRHPHVFAGEGVDGDAELERTWEERKAVEKRRDGVFDGIPPTLPSLARGRKMIDRLARAAGEDTARARFAGSADGDPVAARLLEAVLAARDAGVDPESALRSALGRLRG